MYMLYIIYQSGNVHEVKGGFSLVDTDLGLSSSSKEDAKCARRPNPEKVWSNLQIIIHSHHNKIS